MPAEESSGIWNHSLTQQLQLAHNVILFTRSLVVGVMETGGLLNDISDIGTFLSRGIRITPSTAISSHATATHHLFWTVTCGRAFDGLREVR